MPSFPQRALSLGVGRLGLGRLAAGAAIAAVSFVLVAGAGAPASACSCQGLSEMEAFDAADTVFVGTISEIRSAGGSVFSSAAPERFVFDVHGVYKGAVFARQSVVTARDGASCGLEVSGSDSIVVFAQSRARLDRMPNGITSADDLVEGEVASSLCSGTRVIGSNPLPALFGEPSPPQAGASDIGGGSSRRLAYLGLGFGALGVLAFGVSAVRRRSARAPVSAGH